MSSTAQLTPVEIGQIKARLHDGVGPAEIARIITKVDGHHPSQPSVSDAAEKLREDPSWRGERQSGSGRPRATSPALDKAIVDIFFRHRGSAKVTVAFIKKRIVAARRPDNIRRVWPHMLRVVSLCYS